MVLTCPAKAKSLKSINVLGCESPLKKKINADPQPFLNCIVYLSRQR
jgi:hypothetical protein